jgi:hypothetical protein
MPQIKAVILEAPFDTPFGSDAMKATFEDMRSKVDTLMQAEAGCLVSLNIAVRGQAVHGKIIYVTHEEKN